MKRVILLIVLLVTSNAWAIDPECDIADPRITIVDARGTGEALATSGANVAVSSVAGGFRYCTPRVSDTGAAIPETGYPMTCQAFSPATEFLPAVVIDTVTDKGPGQLVNVVCPVCRFAYDIHITCSNVNGTSLPWVGVVFFPGESPGKPAVQ